MKIKYELKTLVKTVTYRLQQKHFKSGKLHFDFISRKIFSKIFFRIDIRKKTRLKCTNVS